MIERAHVIGAGRVGSALAARLLERGLALKLAPLALPAGGFVGGAQAPVADPIEPLRRAARRAGH